MSKPPHLVPFALRLALVLLASLALTACQPAPSEAGRTENVVLLVDTLRWGPGRLAAVRAEWAAPGRRLLVTGYPAETPAALLARLPWLLQPGVDLFLYDTLSLAPAGLDSLRSYLDRRGHPAAAEPL